ncbi:ankyrin repeat and SOCS box protein 3-like isoform X1 [Synchiropus splendidus]|uniref:ankyrin repeat and SOCS box protein 3-like isoform X1 n=1 Tax=Synchiropus splendidus TaxID=270530 RepID=UPI00237DDC93|nr:ankyrin repeat and SOCS box protein 3-like isoform X1 [Synchiropus splendidus]
MDFTECYQDTVSSVAAAARSGNRAHLQQLIRRGFSVETRDNRGWSPLHEAAAAGSIICVRDILSAAAGDTATPPRHFVNSQTHEGESACFLAARHGHVDVVKLLLRAQSDIDQLTNDLSCPLYTAVDSGHLNVVRLLIRRGAQVNRTHTESCWTCLHQAVYKGHSGIVRLLVKVCNLEARDDHEITPLFVAAQYGRQECLEILIKSGADVNAQAADLATPLMIASQEGHSACVDLLLDQGADPNLACSLDWPQLPIHVAAQCGHHRILSRLVTLTDRACDHGTGQVSPLYMAVHKNESVCVELLLKKGFSPNAQDCTATLGFRSPLSLALIWTSPLSACVKLLVAAGATFQEEDWSFALGTEDMDLLKLVLHHRWIPTPPCASVHPGPHPVGKIALMPAEVESLIHEGQRQVAFASRWLPLVLQAGLDPSLLLLPDVLKQVDGEVLNLLLEFVNWSTMSAHLTHILNERRQEQSWTPSPYYDSPPPLLHLCRLQLRAVFGASILMRSSVVQQLPVPSLLHSYLQFNDILSSFPSPLTPSTHL